VTGGIDNGGGGGNKGRLQERGVAGGIDIGGKAAHPTQGEGVGGGSGNAMGGMGGGGGVGGRAGGGGVRMEAYVLPGLHITHTLRRTIINKVCVCMCVCMCVCVCVCV